jgi:DNA-binding XRE family transcriptional regulator
MDSIIERILKFCDSMGMNISSFASSIGVNQVTLNNYKLGKRKPSLELVEKVTKKYPQVSAEWLLRGIGSMMCGCPPEDNSFYHPSPSAPIDGVSTDLQRTHNGGTA